LRQFVASSALHYQNIALGNLLQMAQHRRPSFVMFRLAYDETGEKVTVPCVGMGPEQQTSTWQVMVSRLEIIVGWSPTRVVKGIIILPALLVAPPNSENMYNCLYYHKLFVPIQVALRAPGNLATWCIGLHETDGAYACSRLFAFLATKKLARDKILECHCVCRLHANQLIQAQVLAALPGKILSRLYSLTLLLRTSGHFARMLKGLSPIAAEAVIRKRVSQSPRPPGSFM